MGLFLGQLNDFSHAFRSLSPDQRAQIELCTGVTREEMSQPAFAGLSALNYPELHEDSIPELAFLRACCKMMAICGISDFGLKDITSPNSKRFRRQL